MTLPCPVCFPQPCFAEWYTQYKNRGYLNLQVVQQNPQLSDRTKAIAKELTELKQELKRE